jgi:hypothetical protein
MSEIYAGKRGRIRAGRVQKGVGHGVGKEVV